MKILVTGGAGYIGSHVVSDLLSAGHEAVILDDLTLGKHSRVADLPLVQFDLAAADAEEKLVAVMKDYEIDGVIHLAARKSVADSVAEPEYYFRQNIHSVNNLLSAMRTVGVSNLVFSSSAAAYGNPNLQLVNEDYQCQPINPYGETKLIGEWMITNSSRAWGLRAISLRYFNVAGAGKPELVDTSVANLIPIAISAVREGRPIQVFGTEWPTPDGSCVRDYIHVSDLAQAHIQSLNYLTDMPADNIVLNVGTGVGSSVLDVIQTIRDLSGSEFEVDYAPPRPGDPASLCADTSKIGKVLGWKAQYTLRDMVESHWTATQQK